MAESLLLLAHGSPDHPAPRRTVENLVAEVEDRTSFTDVGAAYVDDEPHVSEALDAVHGSSAVSVPVFAAEGYYVDTVLPRELPEDVALTPPVGTHPTFSYAIERHAVQAAEDAGQPPRSTELVVVGHGTPRHSASADSVHRHVERLRRRSGFADVQAAFLDQEPGVAELAEAVDTDDAVVVPFFVADGPHATEDVPDAIGFTDTPLQPPETEEIDGVTVTYTVSVVGHSEALEVVVERAEQAHVDGEVALDA